MLEHLDEVRKRKEFEEGIFSIGSNVSYYNLNEELLLPSLRINRTRYYNIDPTSQMRCLYDVSEFSHSVDRLRKIYSFILIGIENSLLAAIFIDGNIRFMETTLSNLPKEYELGGKLDKISEFRNKKCDIYISDNMDEYRIDVIGDLLSSLVYRMDRGEIDAESTNIKLIYDKIEETMERIVLKPSSSLLLLANTNKIYRNCIVDMIETQKESYKNMFQRSLRLIMRLMSVLEKIGYVRVGHDRWKKSVMIVPSVFIHASTYYKMTKLESEPYWVRSIEINLNQLTSSRDLQLTCSAHHPNISDTGLFCMGRVNSTRWQDLTSSFDFTSSDLEEFFLDIEKTMHIINFDSSYLSICFRPRSKNSIKPINIVENSDLCVFDKDRIRSF